MYSVKKEKVGTQVNELRSLVKCVLDLKNNLYEVNFDEIQIVTIKSSSTLTNLFNDNE